MEFSSAETANAWEEERAGGCDRKTDRAGRAGLGPAVSRRIEHDRNRREGRNRVGPARKSREPRGVETPAIGSERAGGVLR